jgi:hypothetical protein
MAFGDDGGHSDALAELRHTLLTQMQRQARLFGAGRAFDLPSAVTAPLNPLGAGAEPGFEGGFATGYDTGTGTTVVPFTVGISTVGGPDVVTGS